MWLYSILTGLGVTCVWSLFILTVPLVVVGCYPFVAVARLFCIAVGSHAVGSRSGLCLILASRCCVFLANVSSGVVCLSWPFSVLAGVLSMMWSCDSDSLICVALYVSIRGLIGGGVLVLEMVICH